MDKINFENLPSTNTPINAENLNQMQDNVENAIEQKIITGQECATNEYIDGKQVFRKIINIGAMPNSPGDYYETTLTGVNIFKVEGYATEIGKTYRLILPSDTVGFHIENKNTGNRIWISTSDKLDTYEGTITLYYTKNS